MEEKDIISWIQRGLDRDPTKTRRGLSLALDRDVNLAYKILDGTRKLKASEISKVAEYLGMPFPGTGVPVVGHVGAGSVHFIDDQGALDEVEGPPNATPRTVAVKVVGNSEVANNAPNGSIIYYDDIRDPPDDSLLDRLCVIWTGDGRAMLKRLVSRGSNGTWTIVSSDGTFERDVEIVAAARVKFIEPR